MNECEIELAWTPTSQPVSYSPWSGLGIWTDPRSREKKMVIVWQSRTLKQDCKFSEIHEKYELPRWHRICLPMQEMQEMQVLSLRQEHLLNKEMATHSNILAWRITRTEDPGRVQSVGYQDDQIRLSTHTHTHTHTHTDTHTLWHYFYLTCHLLPFSYVWSHLWDLSFYNITLTAL